MPRLFVALPLSPAAVADLAAARPAASAGVRVVRPSSLHVTLHYIGDGDLGATAEALSVVSCPAFALDLRGVGRFGGQGRETILWAGVEPSDALTRLHHEIGDALGAVGFRPEARPFRPHVTLARCKASVPRRVVENFLLRGPLLSVEAVPVGDFGLYSSSPSPTGPVYAVERRFGLAAPDDGQPSRVLRT